MTRYRHAHRYNRTHGIVGHATWRSQWYSSKVHVAKGWSTHDDRIGDRDRTGRKQAALTSALRSSGRALPLSMH
jgi:hypothetical protein